MIGIFSYHFSKHKSGFLQTLHRYSVPSNIAPLYFFSSKVLYFGQMQPIKVHFFEIFTCSSQNSSNYSCRFWTDKSISLDISRTFSTLDKRIPSKSQFWDFRVFQWKLARFFMSFSKSHVNFSLNFAWHSSVMKDNSSELYSLVKHFIVWSKAAHQSTDFWDFRVLESKFVKFFMSILKRQSNSSWIFHHLLCMKGINQSGNFWDFWELGSKFTKLLSFWNNKSVFL